MAALDFATTTALTARMATSLADLSPGQLRRAASIKEKMGTLEKELAKIFGNHAPTSSADGRKQKRRKMSAKARALISAAQKKRWAKLKAGK